MCPLPPRSVETSSSLLPAQASAKIKLANHECRGLTVLERPVSSHSPSGLRPTDRAHFMSRPCPATSRHFADLAGTRRVHRNANPAELMRNRHHRR